MAGSPDRDVRVVTKQELMARAEDCANEAYSVLAQQRTRDFLDERIRLGQLYLRLAEAKVPDTPTG